MRDLQVVVEETGKTIIQGVTLSIAPGEVHALMGPNGSGKSTLAYTLMGHPAYAITQGSVYFNGIDITHLEPHKRAQQGIFLSFQTPYEMSGVPCMTFLRESYTACSLMDASGPRESFEAFHERVYACAQVLGIAHHLLERPLNVGASGGEKKRLELLQMMLLEPRFIILDEIDSGLDIDALQAINKALAYCRERVPALSIMVITHYQRLLHVLPPDYVQVIRSGKIVAQGDRSLVDRIESGGYESI